MLQNITLARTATYSAEGESLASLKSVNFIFGTNGVGKTTISRVIADPGAYPTCVVQWAQGRELASFVYNSDFVGRNLTQQQLRGVFTLGDTAQETLDQIEAARLKIAGIQTRIDGLKTALGTVQPLSGKRGERQSLRSDFEGLCWKQIKGKHDAHFKEAFSGVRSAQGRFCDKVLEEAARNTAALSSLEVLKSRAEKVFGGGLQREMPIGEIGPGELLSAVDPVLGKRVVGKENVDVAELIGHLGNSDWVRQGLGYLAPEAPCPFCQQHVDVTLAAKISDYFDETYRRDIARIEAVCTMYAAQAPRFLDVLEELLAQDHRYIDGNALRAEIDRLSAKLDANMRLLADKRREPSASITLEDLVDVWAPIADRFAAANQEIVEHNRLIDNLATEKLALIAEIWRCLIEENGAAIDSYCAAAGKLEQAIGGMENGLGDQTARREEARRELRELERNVTSVEPTVGAINGLLASFGFPGDIRQDRTLGALSNDDGA